MSQAQVTRVRRYKSSAQSRRWGSFGVSVLLHLSLLAAILYTSFSAPKKYNLDTPMLNITQLTIGASGPKPEKQPEVGKTAAPPATRAEAEAVPIPKIEEVAKEAEAAPPKEEEAPPAAEEKPEEPAGPSDEELLAQALAGAKADAKAAPKVSGGQSLLDDALKNAGTDAKTEKIITGESGSGVGALALYQDVVWAQIYEHYTTTPYTDGRIYEVTVLVEIAANGVLVKSTVLSPSGDPSLDARVLRAIREVGRFEPPPGQKPYKLELVFSSEM